jgi:hypothetical protein
MISSYRVFWYFGITSVSLVSCFVMHAMLVLLGYGTWYCAILFGIDCLIVSYIAQHFCCNVGCVHGAFWVLCITDSV